MRSPSLWPCDRCSRRRPTTASGYERICLAAPTPAAVTEAVGGGCAVIGGLVAAIGLLLGQLTGSTTPDTVASALIGLLLLVASVLLVQTNRTLLSGRGVSPALLRELRQVISAQVGVVGVADLFAIVVGPSSLIVDGDVIFDDDLDIPAVEQIVTRCVAALRERWPLVDYVYLPPVSKARPRRAASSRSPTADGH
jgi:divalent metal cation (Fe/Co/Zn/Cd) transporter